MYVCEYIYNISITYIYMYNVYIYVISIYDCIGYSSIIPEQINRCLPVSFGELSPVRLVLGSWRCCGRQPGGMF